MTFPLPTIATVNTIVSNQSVFPRTVSIYRQKVVDGLGNVGYSGAEQSTTTAEGEQLLFAGLAASVQASSVGKNITTETSMLPTDSARKPMWNIFIPSLPIYSVRDRDIVVDDEGYRYEVSSNEWTPLGYKLQTVRQEA